MELLKDNDYACFVDGDAMFTTQYFGKQLECIITKYPDCGLFTAVTNRIGCKWQRVFDWHENDLLKHREFGKKLQDEKYTDVLDVSNVTRREVMGGVLILIKKSTWNKLGKFPELGMLGIDNAIHWQAMNHGEKVYCMTGVYMMHYYRNGIPGDKQHLL